MCVLLGEMEMGGLMGRWVDGDPSFVWFLGLGGWLRC